MRYSEILTKLNESTLEEAPGTKFNVYAEILQDDRDSSLIFKKAFSANDTAHAASKAEKELKRYFSKASDRTQIPGWTNTGPAVDGIQSYYDEDEFISIYDIKAITGSKKKGASPYDMSQAIRASSQGIAEELHGNAQTRWFHADLDGLAYEGEKEEALELANEFAPIYLDGEDRYFVDAKKYNNDGDMGWIWTLAPKAEI